MDSKILFISPPGARNRREHLFREIISAHKGNDYSGILYFAPNSIVASEVKKQFFAFVKKSLSSPAYIPFRVFTVSQFAMGLHETARSAHSISPAVISDRMRTLIISDILRDRNIGYARLLSDLYRKLRHYIPGRELAELREELGGIISEERTKDRAIRALEVLQTYEERKRKKDLADTEDVLAFCVSALKHELQREGDGRAKTDKEEIKGTAREDGGIRLIPRLNIGTVVIDGFFDPAPIEMEIICALTEIAGRAYVLAEQGTGLLQHLKPLAAHMKTITLQRAAYREDTSHFSYHSKEEEAEGIAKEIKKLILDGMAPWEITVCFPSVPHYIAMLRRIFNRFGIPYSITQYELSATRQFAVLQDMLACIAGDYPRNEFLSLVLSPCLPGIPPAVKDSAVTYSYRAGIVKGRQSWLSLRDILLNSLTRDLPEQEDILLDEFQKGVRQVIAALDRIQLAKGISDFADALEEVLGTFGFFDPDQTGGSPAHAKDALHHCRDIFSELRQFSEICGEDVRGTAPNGFYLAYLVQDRAAEEDSSDRVKVLSFEKAAGLEPRVLFFGGLTEDNIPSRPDIDPILPENVKKAIGIPDIEYYINRQKAYFRRLVNLPVHDPYLSYPSADGDKVFLPSPFLDWEKAICFPSRDIYADEDVLMSEGAATGMTPGTFWEAGMFSAKEDMKALAARTRQLFRGYYRVTDIDYYRKCPLRFYIEKVLCLEMEEPPQFEVESRLWGTLAHKTMELLFSDREWPLEELGERLFQGLDRNLKKFPIGEFWAGVAKEIFRKLLPLIREQEAAIREDGYTPWLAEKEISAELQGIRLKGKIDRIDRMEESRQSGIKRSGHPPGLSSVILLDYKTGSVDRDGLQLPLYACMWKQNHPDTIGKTGYYSLKEGAVEWFPKRVTMDEFLGTALQRASEIVAAVRKGSFPPEPDTINECRYCGHRPLCRKK